MDKSQALMTEVLIAGLPGYQMVSPAPHSTRRGSFLALMQDVPRSRLFAHLTHNSAMPHGAFSWLCGLVVT